MKLSVHRRIMVFTIILLTLTHQVYSASTARQPATTPVVLRAERGDTYFNLFGADWQKAFSQNRITVIREGQPLVSPDILLQDQILQVTGDTFLTPRALERVRSIAERRDALRQRLSAFTSQGGAAGAKATALSITLNDDLHYAADLDYLEREVARLAPAPPLQPTPHATLWAGGVALSTLLVCALLATAVLRRRGTQPPTGDDRVRAALRNLRGIVKS